MKVLIILSAVLIASTAAGNYGIGNSYPSVDGNQYDLNVPNLINQNYQNSGQYVNQDNYQNNYGAQSDYQVPAYGQSYRSPSSYDKTYSSVSNQGRGEVLIHRPPPIVVNRPPTRVVVNHPPLIVNPSPVVVHKPSSVVVRKLHVRTHPRPVKVQPVYVNVVKAPSEKYLVNDKYNNQYNNDYQQSKVYT